MANINDYIKWRGDIPFKVASANVVDIMILTQAAYYPWEGIVPAGFDAPVKFSQALSRISWEPQPNTTTKNDTLMAELITESPRYEGIEISHFVNEIEEGSQFAAVTYKLERGLYLVAFRGTDNTLAGWKENMDLAYEDEVPAQGKAVRYLEEAANAVRGKLIVSGHSKGGNLAVYSSAFVSKKTDSRIEKIYNFDGPGFNEEVIKKENFAGILGRVNTLVPQSSLIGMLLEHKEPYIVTSSDARGGAMQHFIHSWQVERDRVCCLDSLSDMGELTHSSLSDWIGGMTYDEKREFIKTIFGLMEKEGFTTVSDLSSPQNMALILKDYSELDKADRKAVGKVLGALTGSVAENIRGRIGEAAAARFQRNAKASRGEIEDKE